MKWIKKYNKEQEIEYLEYLINCVENYIHYLYQNHLSNIKILNSIDIKDELKNIENNLIFNESKTISFFKKRKINILAKKISFLIN